MTPACNRHQNDATEARSGAPRGDHAESGRDLGRRRRAAFDHAALGRRRRARLVAADCRLRARSANRSRGCRDACEAEGHGRDEAAARKSRKMPWRRRVGGVAAAPPPPPEPIEERRRPSRRAVPGDVRRPRPPHRSGHRRSQARRARERTDRAGALLRTVPKVDPQGLPLCQADACRRARRCCPGSLSVPRRHVRWHRQRARCCRPAKSTILASAPTIRSRCATPSSKKSAARPASFRRPGPTAQLPRHGQEHARARRSSSSCMDQIPVSQNQDIKVEYIGQGAADQDEHRGQARLMTLRIEARAGRGEGLRVRLPHHLAGREPSSTASEARPGRCRSGCAA